MGKPEGFRNQAPRVGLSPAGQDLMPGTRAVAFRPLAKGYRDVIRRVCNVHFDRVRIHPSPLK